MQVFENCAARGAMHLFEDAQHRSGMHELLHTTSRNEKRMMGISCQALGIQTLLTLQLRAGRNDHNFDTIAM